MRRAFSCHEPLRNSTRRGRASARRMEEVAVEVARETGEGGPNIFSAGLWAGFIYIWKSHCKNEKKSHIF
jgi:hypothetical protein